MASLKMETAKPIWLIRNDSGTGAMNPASSMSNQRRHPRQRTLKSAQIVFQSGRCTMACQILNTSDAGALLMPADILICPNEFMLKPLFGTPHNCEVVWRKGTKLGVRYV
jgi:hypothetical protein